MPNVPEDLDVLIVGAGPVGLFLANECARRGLRWRIVESRATQSEHSKALAIFPRTLEIFDMAGLVGPFLEVANRVTSVAVVAHGHRLAHIEFAPGQSPYPFIAMVPQNVTEGLLADALRRRGGTIEYETSFVSATQDGDHVTATLDHKGERSEARASFVVGCDGAHSAVRHMLNLQFEGAAYDALFMLADVEAEATVPADELVLCPSEFGPVAAFPMSATRWRIVATIEKAEGDAPTLDVVRSIVARRGPRGLEPRALHWSSYFRIHHRHAAHLRVGRMFIAGDAAHIHSPFGGQGMNTGLHDIWNLAWKLDLFRRGHGNERLLESYEAERLPVIRRVIETTHLLTRAMGTASKLAQTLRDAIIPVASRLPSFQSAFVQRLSGLGIAYRGSPIIEGSGQRYIEDSLRGGEGIRSRFLLMVGGGASPATRESARRVAESFPNVVELRSGSGRGVALVRPDGYVAYASHALDDETALESARRVLERQTT